MKIKVETEVEKEAYELFQAFAVIVKSVKGALDDGFQMEKDLPVIVAQALTVIGAITNINKLGDNWKEDPGAFIKAASIGGADIAAVFLKKDFAA